MMTEADKFWAELVGKVGRRDPLGSLSREEAEAELDSAPEEPLSQQEIEAIVKAAVSGKTRPAKPVVEPVFPCEVDAAEVREEVLQLNRSPGEVDPESQKLLEELRRKALSDEETDGQEEPPGVDDGAASSGNGR